MISTISEFPGTFPGTIKVPLHIPTLVESADVVCQGNIVHLYDEGEVQYLVTNERTTFTKKVAIFSVEHIYKGAIVAPSIAIEFLQADFPSSMERLHQDEHLVLFLKKKNGAYQLASPTTSKISLGKKTVPKVRGEQSPLASIREGLIAALNDTNWDSVLPTIEQIK